MPPPPPVSAPPLPPSPPSPPLLEDAFFGTPSSQLTDHGLVDSAWISLAFFLFFLLLYLFCQTQSILYKFRLVSPSVSCKPPSLPEGVHAAWAWLWATLMVSDADLLASAGLDALMMVKMQTLGIQLFVPMAVIGGVILIPINSMGGKVSSAAEGDSINPSKFMYLTVTNVNDGSPSLWAHFCCVVLFVSYTCWILKWHYHQFVLVRQHYQRKGEDINVWRELQADDDALPPSQDQGNVFEQLLGIFRASPLAAADLDGQAGQPVADTAAAPVSPSLRHAPQTQPTTTSALSPARTGPTGVATASVAAAAANKQQLANAANQPVVGNDPAERQRQLQHLNEMINEEIRPARSRRASTSGRAGGATSPKAKSGSAESTGTPTGGLPDVHVEPQGRPHTDGQGEVASQQAARGSVASSAYAVGDGDVELGLRRRGSGTTAADGEHGTVVGAVGSDTEEWNPAGEIQELPRWWADSRHYTPSSSRCTRYRPDPDTEHKASVLQASLARARALAKHTATLSRQALGRRGVPSINGTDAAAHPGSRFKAQLPGAGGSGTARPWWAGVGASAQHASARPSGLDRNSSELAVMPLMAELNASSLGQMGVGCFSYAPAAVPAAGGAAHAVAAGAHGSGGAAEAKNVGLGGAGVQDDDAEGTAGLLHGPSNTQADGQVAAGGMAAWDAVGEQQLLAQPSVRFRKTINAVDDGGGIVAVNAQQYTILVTDVNQDSQKAGARLWDAAPQREGEGLLSCILPGRLRKFIFHNYAAATVGGRRPAEACTARGGGDASVSGARQKDGLPGSSRSQGASSTAFSGLQGEAGSTTVRHAAVAGLDGEEAGTSSSAGASPSRRATQGLHGSGTPPAPHCRRPRVLRPGSRWAAVQGALRSGRLAALPHDKEYSVVSATFARLFPEAFDRAVPVLRHGEVDALLHQLDQAMWRYEIAETQWRETGRRPKARLGLCGLCGTRVDLMRHHKQEMLELQAKIHAERARLLSRGSTPSWIVFFKTQAAAAQASQTLIHGEDNREFQVVAAPGPEEVNWSALWMSYRQRNFRGWLVVPALVLILLIPISAFSAALMQLQLFLCPSRTCQDPLTGATLITNKSCPAGTTDVSDKFFWPMYCDADDDSALALTGRLLVGWVPALLVTLWQGMVLPLVTYLLVQAGGRCFSLSAVDLAIAHWIWFFSAFNSFLGGVIGSTIVSQVQTLIANGPWQVVAIVGNYLPSSSSFFLSYVMFRTLVSLPLRMVQPNPSIRFYFLRRWLRWSAAPLTDRDKAFIYAPCSPRYGYDVGILCGVYLVAFAYAVVSPIVTIACAVYFTFGWTFWRYNLLYVYIRKYESGGLMWPFLFRNICTMLIVMALFTSCVFTVKGAYIQAGLLVVSVPFCVVRFQLFCYHRFQKGIDAMPLVLAAAAPPAQVDPRVYIPPPLHKRAVGWYPEWTKPWSGWGLPG